jgi:hypothetical protein
MAKVGLEKLSHIAGRQCACEKLRIFLGEARIDCRYLLISDCEVFSAQKVRAKREL